MSPRHGSGYEIISRASLNISLPTHITEDINIIAFRFFGMKPMLGYKNGAIFHVLWLDRNFKAYPHS